jgi:hypothetical protein
LQQLLNCMKIETLFFRSDLCTHGMVATPGDANNNDRSMRAQLAKWVKLPCYSVIKVSCAPIRRRGGLLNIVVELITIEELTEALTLVSATELHSISHRRVRDTNKEAKPLLNTRYLFYCRFLAYIGRVTTQQPSKLT